MGFFLSHNTQQKTKSKFHAFIKVCNMLIMIFDKRIAFFAIKKCIFSSAAADHQLLYSRAQRGAGILVRLHQRTLQHAL